MHVSSDPASAIECLIQALGKISAWIRDNWLKLNPYKTKVMLVFGERNQKMWQGFSLPLLVYVRYFYGLHYLTI